MQPVTACRAVAFGEGRLVRRSFSEGGSENEAKIQKNRCLFSPHRMAAVFLKML
jgi:hypothetical protein